MGATCKMCTTEDELVKISLFLLQHKRDLHPSFTTLSMVSLIYSYATQGNLFYAEDSAGHVVGAAAYYHGTPEQNFQDLDVALVDIGIFDPAYRGSRLFVRGMHYMIQEIMRAHPEVRELRLVALAENDYLYKLYSKFTSTNYLIEDESRRKIVFSVKINEVRPIFNRLIRL